METMIVLGASPNPERFSFVAVRSLLKRNYNVVAIGKRPGKIQHISIQTDMPDVENVHSILMYVRFCSIGAPKILIPCTTD